MCLKTGGEAFLYSELVQRLILAKKKIAVGILNDFTLVNFLVYNKILDRLIATLINILRPAN